MEMDTIQGIVQVHHERPQPAMHSLQEHLEIKGQT